MYRLNLLAVDSKIASEEAMAQIGLKPEQLPADWRLMAHQVETLRVLRAGTAEILINTALTGDGKSLAAQLSVFLDQTRALFMYPTNELAADQMQGLERNKRLWQVQTLRQRRLDRSELDRLQAQLEGFSRADVLRLLTETDLLLTNPDLFHLMMQFQYQSIGASPDQLPIGRIANRYGLFVFDEFHLFGMPQVAAALISLLMLRAVTAGSSQPSRFLFLSATPQEMLLQMAAQSGLNIHLIQGQYRHGEPSLSADYRRILQPVLLNLWPGRIEDWINEHLQDVLLAFFLQHRPGAKGLIVANSVATAHRLVNILREPLAQAGFSVAPNTGLTDRETRQQSYQADLLVGTSTIDVGVDFHINLLIFESTDAASHLQRLGRLGRHTDDGRGHSFHDHFEAHALLPPWIIETLQSQFPVDSLIDRESYGAAILNAFPIHQLFKFYPRDWASLQAFNVLNQLNAPPIQAQYETIRQQLWPTYGALFGVSSATRGRYIELRRDARPLVDEAISFRGGSPFVALVIGESGHIQPYNLISLLRQADLEPIELAVVYALAEKAGNTAALLQRDQPLVAYRLHGWLPKARRLRLRLDQRIDDWPSDRFGTACVLRGFALDAPGVSGLITLNKTLETRELVTTLVRGYRPDDLRRRLKLGYQFELLEFASADGIEGSAAFAREALLLDSALRRSSLPAGGDLLIY
ncbi:MAG TPA: type I-D CRISPR-associated helicase Cas3' [Phototrophicaceae bacterium]|nr:type I-D CRISPR-associated helicase Cas3' [Phototrophicaceae bacterium]